MARPADCNAIVRSDLKTAGIYGRGVGVRHPFPACKLQRILDFENLFLAKVYSLNEPWSYLLVYYQWQQPEESGLRVKFSGLRL